MHSLYSPLPNKKRLAALLSGFFIEAYSPKGAVIIGEAIRRHREDVCKEVVLSSGPQLRPAATRTFLAFFSQRSSRSMMVWYAFCPVLWRAAGSVIALMMLRLKLSLLPASNRKAFLPSSNSSLMFFCAGATMHLPIAI